MVSLNVCDTGIGIPPEKITEIFEPFHQLDGSATRRYGGTGLGLALVRQIVEAHGSLVSVESTPDQGTTFSFPLLLAVPMMYRQE
jgi:signal transduction histidine kinase